LPALGPAFHFRPNWVNADDGTDRRGSGNESSAISRMAGLAG